MRVRIRICLKERGGARVIWENGILIAPEGERPITADLACHFGEEKGVIEPMSCLGGDDHVDTSIR